MRKLLLITAIAFPIGIAQAADTDWCGSLQRIDQASLDGFKQIPRHMARGVPDGLPDPMIPKGSGALLTHGLGTKSSQLSFSVNYDAGFLMMMKAAYQASKIVVVKCLPGVVSLGEDASGMTPVVKYLTKNGMKIEISQDTGGSGVETFLVHFDFITTIKVATASHAQKPDEFVQSLYKRYYQANNGSVPYNQVYSPDLLKTVGNNTDRDGGPIYDGDPFVDSQEADVRAVKVVKLTEDDSHAIVAANIINSNDKKTIMFQLVKINGTWKIDNIGNMRKVFASARH